MTLSEPSQRNVRVAIDIGGTFTDLMAVDEATGEFFVHKFPSSGAEPISAVRGVLRQAGLSPEWISRLVHGTTVATNALLQRDVARVAFVTNRGFRDVVFIQDGTRRDLYSLDWRKSPPLVARYDCVEVDCRMDCDGAVVEPVTATDVEAVVRHLRQEGIRSVAIGLLFAHVDGSQELELEAALREAMPGLTTSVSHRIYPRWRENDRWQTVVADASLKDMFGSYVEDLAGGLADDGVSASLVLMKSNGGIVEARTAAEQPVNYLVSGPVGGVLGGWHFAALAGFTKIMTIDIGGTSSDVSLVVDGEIPRVAKFQLDHGIPVKAPQLDIETIGSGGGSIGWIDTGGLLRVGPRSAGSVPGPACFGRGGVEPTLTDACLLLGYLDPDDFAAGQIQLDVEASRTAIRRLSDPAGQSPEQTAGEMLRLAAHDMVDALRVISIDRGIDPRDFALVAFGGAGGLYGAEVARALGARTVLVPPYPGNTSAYGLLTAGLRTDLAATLLLRSDDHDVVAGISAALQPLHDRAVASLEREGLDGVAQIEHRLEMRYYGQNYHREVVITPTLPLDQEGFDAAVARFHQEYETFYGYQQPWEHIEVVGAVVTASSRGYAPNLDVGTIGDAPAEWPVRSASFGGVETKVPVLVRSALPAGFEAEGPLIVNESLTTTLVPPGARLRVHDSGNLLIEITEEAS